MAQLIWTESALRDLADIDDHLIEQDAGPAAVRILGAVRAATDRLRDYPAIGRSGADDIRVWQIARTADVLPCTIGPDDVAILRILHEPPNWRDERASLP